MNREKIDELRERAIKELAVLSDVGHARVLEYLHAIEMDRGELLTALRVGRGPGQKPLIQNGHRVLYAVAPPVNQRGVGVVEDLGVPSALEKNEQEEETSLDAPSVQEGDLVSGLEGDESGGGHGPPDCGGLQSKYLMNLADRVSAECARIFTAEYVRGVTQLKDNDFRALAATRERWKLDALALVCHLIREDAKELRMLNEPTGPGGVMPPPLLSLPDAVTETQAFFRQFKKPGESVVDELLAERKAEAKREEGL